MAQLELQTVFFYVGYCGKHVSVCGSREDNGWSELATVQIGFNSVVFTRLHVLDAFVQQPGTLAGATSWLSLTRGKALDERPGRTVSIIRGVSPGNIRDETDNN